MHCIYNNALYYITLFCIVPFCAVLSWIVADAAWALMFTRIGVMKNLGIEYSRRCLEWLAAWNRHHDMDTNQPDIEKEQRKKRKVFGLMISATGGSKRFHVQTTRSKDNMSHLSDRSLPPSLLQLHTTERLLSLRATSLTSRCRFCDPADVLFEG